MTTWNVTFSSPSARAVIGPSYAGGNPEDFDATGDGTTNDSAAFTTGLSARYILFGVPGETYAIKDIAVGGHRGFDGRGCLVTAFTGATNLFSASGYSTHLKNFYVSSGLNCSGALIRIGTGRYGEVSGITAVNTGAGFIDFTLASPSTTTLALFTVSGCKGEGVTGTAINIGSSVVELQMDRSYFSGSLVASTGGDKPTPGSIGWRQNTPLSGGNAVGGHQVDQCGFLAFDTGMWITDGQLSTYTGVNLDSCSDYGLVVDGASQSINFASLFVGASRGIKIAGTSQVNIDGLETIQNGTIPPWGSTDFYDGTAYDLKLEDAAVVHVRGWKGDKKISVASGAKLVVDDGEVFRGRSISNVSVAAPSFLAEQGHTTALTEAIWRIPYDCYLVRISATPTAAPGSGQVFIYTAQLNSVDTALTQTLSGAADFGGRDTWAASPVAASKGQYLSIALAPSGSAAVTVHWCEVQIVPR